jgi:tetratricopeptide (TPR) repeat protein
MAKKKNVVRNKTTVRVDNPGTQAFFGLTEKKSVIAVLILSFLAFLPSLWAEFVIWDDPEYTFANPLLLDFSLSKVFSTSTFHMGNYHPLTITWLYLESKLFGFEPFGFHLNNLLLHVANTYLVFLIAKGLINQKNLFVPVVTALLFGIHPMRTESVVWVSELKDVLYAFFFLLALWQYVKYVRNEKITTLVTVGIFFLLSLLSKGQAVVLPVILLVFDLYMKRKWSFKWVLEKLPLFTLSVIFGLIAIKAQKAESAINADYQGIDSLFYGSYGLMAYLYKFFLPINLSGAHPYPFNPVFEDMPSYFYIMPVLVLLVAGLVFFLRNKRRSLWFGFLFFVVSVSIVLKLIPVGDTIIAERYTYIPYFGLFFALAAFLNSWSFAKTNSNVIKYGGGALIALLCVMSYQRTTVWENTNSFWSNVSTTYPDYWRSYNNLGEMYEKQGEYEKAVEFYTQSVEKDKYAPPIPFIKRGNLYMDRLSRADLATKDFEKACNFPNKGDQLHYSAALNLAQAHLLNNNPSGALESIKNLEVYFPKDAIIYLTEARAFATLNQFEASLNSFAKSIELDPNNLNTYLKRGIVFTDQMNRFDEGIADFQKVLSIDPGHKDAAMNMGIAYYKKGDSQNAVAIYDTFIAKNPNEARTYLLRAYAHEVLGNWSKALADAMQCQKLGAGFPPDKLALYQQNASR